MTKLAPAALLAKITDSLAVSGSSFATLNTEKPFLLALDDKLHEQPVRIFIWNITHGGATRNPNEYRIQVTPAMPTPRDDEKIVVLGWYEDLEVFAAWDPASHSERTATSPSLQVGLDHLQAALTNGIDVERRGSGDTVVIFKPDLLSFYLDSAEEIHSLTVSEILSVISDDQDRATSPSMASAPIPDRSIVERIVAKRYRDATFSRRVREAYENTCVVCGVQLSLIEAAHILPVAVNGSTDETSNGIALCRNHHYAFDVGLFTFDNQFKFRLVAKRLLELDSLGLTSGLPLLSQYDGQPMLKRPANAVDRPSANFMKLGRIARDVDDEFLD